MYETFKFEDIPVGANVDIGKPEVDEIKIPIKNNKLKKKTNSEKRALRDHDYTFSKSLLQQANAKIIKLNVRNKLLRKTIKKQGDIIKRKTKSVSVWKQKFRNLKQKLAIKQPKQTATFLAELAKNAGRPSKGERYSLETKNLALCLFYCSTRTYQEIRKHLKLPSPRLIKKWIKSLKINDGMSTTVLQLLKEKSKTLTKRDRVVCVSIDEISLKPNLTYFATAKPDVIIGFPSKVPGINEHKTTVRATSALVIMIKFVSTGYKQSIGYLFSHEGFKANELVAIVELAMNSIVDAGLIPKVIVCDQNATNRSLFTKLGINEKKPYYLFRGEKIFGMFDAPHLLKSSRNNIMRHNAIYDGKVAKWDHIRMLYDHDSTRLPRAAPKLSNGHIFLPAFGEMRVGVAAETLSQTVASAIRLYVASDVLPDECEATARFCSDIDRLFDVFNAFDGNVKENKVNNCHYIVNNSYFYIKGPTNFRNY